MNTHLKTALLLLSFIGASGLIQTIQNGYAGSRIAGTRSNTIAAGSSGRQWIWQNPLPQGNTLQDFSFIDTNNGFAVGARGTILKTTDGGNNWELIAGETEDDLYGVSFTDSNIGTVVGNFGAILRTTDAGNHWAIQREGISDVLYGVSFTDANNGTSVGSDGLILRTTNGGTNWVQQTGGTTNFLNDVSFTDANNGTAVGDNGTILGTTNGGTTWTPQTSDTQTTSTEFFSLTPIPAVLLDQIVRFLGRRTVEIIGCLRPIQFLLTSTMLCLLMQIPERLSVRWG
jgi:photosystem II stability/assembly factor-like uncharacterized protein